MKKVTQAERQAAADRLKAQAAAAGLTAAAPTAGGITPMAAFPVTPGAIDLATGQYLVGPEGQLVPDYSGLVANWAYSPMPTLVAGSVVTAWETR